MTCAQSLRALFVTVVTLYGSAVFAQTDTESRAGAPGQLSPDADQIRAAVVGVTDAILRPGALRNLPEQLTAADRERLGDSLSQLRDDALDQKLNQLRQEWKIKYGGELDLQRNQAAFNDPSIKILPGDVTDAARLAGERVDAAREPRANDNESAATTKPSAAHAGSDKVATIVFPTAPTGTRTSQPAIVKLVANDNGRDQQTPFELNVVAQSLSKQFHPVLPLISPAAHRLPSAGSPPIGRVGGPAGNPDRKKSHSATWEPTN